MTGSTAGEINETPCIIFFTDNTEEAKEILKPIAVKYVESLKTGAVSEKICFFYHNDGEEEDDDIGTSLKTFANLKKDVPLLVLIDVPSEEVLIIESHYYGISFEVPLLFYWVGGWVGCGSSTFMGSLTTTTLLRRER